MKHFTLVLTLLISSVGYAQISLPIDFESSTINYAFTDFGGGQMSKEDNPDMSGINTSSKVARMIKNAPEVYGGSFLELAGPIDFSVNKHFKMKVWTPGAGRKVLLKVENLTNGGIAYEQEKTTTTGNAWEELVFDFTGVNTANSYQKLVFIFDLGTVGDGSANFTFYVDDIEQFNAGTGKAKVDLPITFQDTATVDYALVDFGGNASSIVQDPTAPGNLVGKAVKTAGAELWAGTTNGGNSLANPIPFTADDTKISVRVWSPDANTPIRLKVEDASNGGISVETEANTTMAGEWETLVFDFSNQATGTAALNLANTYNKLSIFFNFGTTGAMAGEKTYYWDNVRFGLGQVDLPITFQDTASVDYNLVDFGGNASSIVVDPTDPNNLVGKAIKTGAAELWAGTSNGGSGLARPIPFTMADTRMSVRVWSPDAGTPIRLKVENAANGAISVETEVNTTMAGAWETLEFNFSDEVPGTAPINVANTYNKVSIFFNFGTTGAMAGEKTYYWDDVKFIGGGGSNLSKVDLPITFQDTATVDYDLVDFGGNVSSIVEDPTDPNNLVGKVIKTGGAELWAGTTNGGSGLANPIPFTVANTRMTVRVWSPDANTPIRLKVEDASNPTISVETEANTTMAGAWETLEFNFSNQAPGTAAINVANTYNKVSIFFNFGTTGAMAGEKTYYWDDIKFGGLVDVKNLEASEGGIHIFPNPAADFCTIAFSAFSNDPVNLSMFDASGKLVKTLAIAQQNSKLDLQEFNDGLYYLRIEKDSRSYFQKLVIVR